MKEKNFEDEEESEHPIFNRTGAILLLFVLLMLSIFWWHRDVRNIYQRLGQELIYVEDQNHPSYGDLIDFRNQIQIMVDVYEHSQE